MLDLLSLGNAQCVEHADQLLGTEQTHQVVFQGNVKSGFTGISLTSGTSAQLVVDTAGLMALRTDDLQSACCPGFLIQLDIRTTSAILVAMVTAPCTPA